MDRRAACGSAHNLNGTADLTELLLSPSTFCSEKIKSELNKRGKLPQAAAAAGMSVNDYVKTLDRDKDIGYE